MTEELAPPVLQQPDVGGTIRARIAVLGEQRKARIEEMERIMRAQVQQFDLAIAELNAVLVQIGQKAVVVDNVVKMDVPRLDAATTRAQAVAALSPENVLRRKMGK